MRTFNVTLAIFCGLFLLAIGGAVTLWVYRAWFEVAPPVPDTEVVYVDRPLVRTDTVTVDRPVTRVLYRQVTDTVYVHVPVPGDFRPYGVISAAPVKIDGRRVTVSYWQPDSLRWMQDTYATRPPVWGYGVHLGAFRDAHGYGLTGRATIRFKRVSLWGGVAAHKDGVRPAGGVLVRLWGRP